MCNIAKMTVLIFFLFAVINCSHTKKTSELKDTVENKGLIKINIDSLDTENPLTFSSVFRSYKLVPLETNDKCLIGQVDHIKVFNDTIYILDSFSAKALFAFDENGNFIRKIGRLGKGPGEYLKPLSFTIDVAKKQIQLWDGHKIIVFSLGGGYIKELKIRDGLFVRCIETLNGITYLNHDPFKGRAQSHLLSSVDREGRALNQWLPSENYIKGFKQPMKTSNLFCKTLHDIKFMQPFLDTIFSIHNNTVKPYMAFSTKNKLTPDDIGEMNRIKDPFMLAKQYWKCKKFLGVRDYVENQDLTMFLYQNNGRTHTLFYFPDKSKIVCTKYEIFDDLTHIDGYRRFFTGYKNYFVSAFDHSGEKLDQLIKNIENKTLIIGPVDNCRFETINSTSNPVVVYYECRKDLAPQQKNID